MTACLRRTVMPEASAGAVDRAMRTLALVGVRRDRLLEHITNHQNPTITLNRIVAQAMVGGNDAAQAYRRAIATTVNLAEQRHLRDRVRGLTRHG